MADTQNDVPFVAPASSTDDTFRHEHIVPYPQMPAAPHGYDLLRRLGGGGMGEVYLAREHATERIVAMKFLYSGGDRSAHERFLVEVRALAKIDHPNIIRVLNADVNRRDPYFTMDYAEGGTLGRWVEDHGPLPPREAATLARTIAGALAAAHAASVIHRDVKPSNILLRRAVPDAAQPLASVLQFIPVLSDFGLAKRVDRDDGLSASSGGMGTPGYMPPEQVSSQHGELGPASDVYSLGATLFHVLSRRAPFRGGSAADLAVRVVNEPAPRLRTVAPQVPRELEAIVARCLEKNPARRYATANDLADDLARFLDGRAPRTPLLSWRRRLYRTAVRHRLRIAGVVMMLAAVLAVGAVAARPVDRFADTRRTIAAGKIATLVESTGLPKFHRSVLGNAVAGLSDMGDHTATFTTLGHGVTELLPDPGWDHFRFTAEIRQLETGAQSQPSIDRVGLYFGYAHAMVGERAVHLMQAVRFNDYDAAVLGLPSKPRLRLGTFGCVQRHDESPYTSVRDAGLVPFVPTGRIGRWQLFVVEASPNGVRVQWRNELGTLQTLAEWSAARCQKMWDEAKQQLEGQTPGTTTILPEWHPRRAIGVLTFKATVAIRNVTLEPLP